VTGPARRRFLAGLVAALLAPAAFVPAAAASTDRAEQFIRQLAAKGIELLTEEGLAHDERVRRVRGLMTDYFDIEAIGRWVLGRHWRRATVSERQEFLALFEDWIALGYAARFGEYAGQTVHVIRSVDLGRNTVVVRSEVVQPGGTQRILVDWRVHGGSESLRIVDVAVEGTSMSRTVRSDFGSTVRQGGDKVSVLIEALRDKVDALKVEAAAQKAAVRIPICSRPCR